MVTAETDNKHRFSGRDIFRLAQAHRGLLVGGLIGLAVGSGINLVIPELIRQMLNSDYTMLLVERPAETGLAIVALFAIQALAFYIRSYYFAALGQRVVSDLRKRLFSSMMVQPIEFFDRERVGDLVSRLSADTLMLQDAVSTKLSVFIRYTFQVAVGIALMMMLSIRLTLAIVFLVPLIIALSMTLGRRLKKCSKAQQAELGRSTGLAEESFSAARVVKAFNREQQQISRYHQAIESVLQLGLRRSEISAFFSSFVSFLMNASIVLVLLYGIYLVSAGELAIGNLTAFILYGVIVAVSFAFVAGGYAEFVQAFGAGERVFELLDESTPASNGARIVTPQEIHGSFALQDLTFSYPSRPDRNALQNVSVVFEAGKTTALVGPSGSGKSTVVNLLFGFYSPKSGSIALDGMPLSSLDIGSVRDCMALVPQEPQLFALSIADNLRFGKEDATLDELREACQRARILEFIDSLPQKFETQVGERGVLLSAGQKQRVAIARAILKNPKILILDEATSALDSENEFLVQEALAEVTKNRTVIVIAHRLATVKNADRVIVLKGGSLAQSGTHSSLSNSEGLYRQLVERQELSATN